MKIYNFLLLTLIFSSLPIKAGENFTGEFDTSNWSTVGSSGTGSVDTSNAPDSITITGPDNDNAGAKQKFFIQTPSVISGTYGFDWAYTTNDDPLFDFPNLINGSSTTLFTGYQMSGNINQSGSISVDVEAGDIFGFEIETDDGCCGPAFLTISSLVTPEPPDTGDAAYSISGTTSAGSTLTTSVSTDDPDGNGTVSSYTWQSSSDGTTWTSITGATGSTFTLTESEEGKYIRVTVDYTDGSSTSESVTASSVTIPHVDSGDATYSISGTTTAGSVLTAAVSDNDDDGNGTVNSYQWQSSTDGSTFTSIAGATSSTYTLTASEEGEYVRVIVNYTDGEGFDEEVSVSSITIPHVDSGDAVFAISGSTYAGKILTAAQSSSDPDGDGTFSYKWQSSSDTSSWTDISGATNSTFTVTESEEGKYIRLVITYTDLQNFSESVLVSAVSISQLHTEWVQPYAAMQNIGLASIKNNRDLVLAKAGECNKHGWVIGDTDYCVYTNANNTNASVNGNSGYGGYDYAKFNTSINIEKTINDRWKAGVAYGVGSSNLDNYNFSSTTASLSSTNTHYSIYGVKKVSDKFTLKGMIGGSDFDYKGNRNYSTTSATSAYDTDGYTAEINGIWDIKKKIKNMKTPIRLQPTVGVAHAAHTQDGFSESGSGDLVTIDPNQAESILFKTGISIDKQIPMEGGKWILVPSLALNYEMDPYSDDDHRSIKGGLTESSTAHTKVSSKTLGQHNGSVKVGADFICTKDFMFNLNAEYGLAEGGDEQSYGGGFRWHF